MTAPRTTQILVAVDFSPAARAALVWACAYANSHPGQLHVLHVVDGHLAGSMEEVTAELDRFTAEVGGLARGAVMKHIGFGKPGREIVRIAEKLGSDLVVMGTYGARGLAALIVGSVARRVVRSAPCPVVVVKAPEAARAAA
jgi:nucleotide-binding universal stress UspA family protein